MRRFTLSQLLIMVAAIAYCIGMYRFLGRVLGNFFILLMICYAMASFLSLRTRAVGVGVCSFFALLPWLGLGGGAFSYPGTRFSLPTVALPSLLEIPLSWIYFLAEMPLDLVAENSPEFWEAIFFDTSLGIMRPFAIFVFWLGFALVFGLSIGIFWYAKRRCQRETKQTA